MDYFQDYSFRDLLRDFYGRRNSLRDALKTRDKVFDEKLATARQANVPSSLYGAPNNGTWFFLREDEEVPMGLPRPPVVVELNTSTMDRQEFISHVTEVSDQWLLDVLYFIGNKSKVINPYLLFDMKLLLPEIMENDGSSSGRSSKGIRGSFVTGEENDNLRFEKTSSIVNSPETSSEGNGTSKLFIPAPKGFDNQSGKATCGKSLDVSSDKCGYGTAIVDENPHTCDLQNSNKGNEAHSLPEVGTSLDPSIDNACSLLVSTRASHTSACLQDDRLFSVSEGLETESTSTCDLFADNSCADHSRRRKVPKALRNSSLWDDQQTNCAHPLPAKRVRELASSHAEGTESVSRASQPARRNKS